MIREACWTVVKEFALAPWRILIYLIRKAGKINMVSLVLKPVEKWEWAFVVSCIAVSLDPLFLYIPIVDEKNKCLAMDKTLRNIVIIVRSLTDFLLISRMIAQKLGKMKTDYEMPPQLASNPGFHEKFDSDIKNDDSGIDWFYASSLITTVLAVLPIPQVAILVGFFRLGGSDFSITRKFLNMSLVLQYIPRVTLIYLSRSQFSMGFGMVGKLAKPAFNLFLYILASQVLGALWYFFAIERETSCWYGACRKTPGCIASAYKCGASSSVGTKNATLLNQLCPITSPNTTEFDFGIFVKVLQSGNTGSVDFPRKIFYTLWWGLKNLSNFGTNLDTSSYLWENCFAILICVIGLLLFLYLIGNMQVFMQSATTNALEYEKLRQEKIAEKKGEIVNWMKENLSDDDTMGLRGDIKTAIRDYKVLERNLTTDVDVKYFVNDTPFSNRIRQSVLEHLGLPLLKTAAIFADTPEDKLRSLCQKMTPVTYSMNDDLVGANKELDKMIFIIRGEITYHGRKYLGKTIEKWVAFNFLKRSYCDPLPKMAAEYIKSCDRKVEALALKAWDILRFVEDNFKVDSPHLKDLASDYNRIVDEKKEINGQDPLIPSEVWEHPGAGWVKLNCSYVWKPETRWAAFGCVLRNDKGELIKIASVGSNNHQFIDKFHVGASCIWHLLKFAVQLVKTGQLIVESDDNFLIDFLQKGPPFSDERVLGILRPVLQNIVTEVLKFKKYKFAHCKRQTNSAAIRVAEHAVESADVSELKIWENYKDIQGLPDALEKDSPLLYEGLREKELAAQKANVDSGSSTSAVAAAPSSNKETVVVEIKESSQEA